jgi:hypothetical protein
MNAPRDWLWLQFVVWSGLGIALNDWFLRWSALGVLLLLIGELSFARKRDQP